MRKSLLLIIPTLLLMGCWGGAPTARLAAPPPTKLELPEVSMLQRYYAHNDTLHLILQFEDVRRVVDLLEVATAYEYEVRAGGQERDALLLRDSLNVPGRKITDMEGQRVLQVALPGKVVREPNVLHFKLWQHLVGQEVVGNRFSVPLHSRMLRKDYLLRDAATNKPHMPGYATTSDKLIIQRFDTSAGPLKLQRFDADFRPAAPPMSLRPADVPRTLSASQALTISPSDTLPMTAEGFYMLVDPSTTYDTGLLVLPGDFPQITRAEEMLEPLVYMTTSAERERLASAKDKKAAIDAFWLELGGSKARARDLIREFYGRVEYANRLFTSHKAGWATDRGMIYIVFGQPSKVSQVGETITWLYQDAERAPYLKFVFTKKGNNFTENHYELIRRHGYEESWYSTVAKWRAGKINT